MSFEYYLTGVRAKPLVSKKKPEKSEEEYDGESQYLESMRRADQSYQTEW